MDPVSATLAGLIGRYPCAYSNRTQALHQALIVLGNGMVWRHGLLVDRAGDPRDCRDIHQRSRLTAAETKLYAAAGITPSTEQITGACPAEPVRARAAELAHEPGPLDREPYPPSLQIPLFLMPADADPHWQHAARETAAVVAPLWQQPSVAVLATENEYTAHQRTAALERIAALLT
ncbi:hypothetical protein ABZY20_30610 [Streptomyces sp. NPDC006624]|uniref:hypothetical protein n=1 Tax=Streptomyces sp. NPDC006624 TaxID=3154892 RepID=UPI0033ADBB2C